MDQDNRIGFTRNEENIIYPVSKFRITMMLRMANRASIFFLILTAVLMFWTAGCAKVYIPDESALQKMSPAEARRTLPKVLQGAPKKPILTGPDMKNIYIEDIKMMSYKSIVLIGEEGKRFIYPLHDIEVRYESSDGVVDINKHHLYRLKPGNAMKLVDSILVLKKVAVDEGQYDSNYEKAIKASQNVAAKPILSEDARRYKVQAESAIRDKIYYEAADLLRQALNIAPLWPEGHFNRAIVLSEVGEFDLAINEMKRYIRLEPDAPNYRAAQDKIYDWERKASKQN